MSTQSLAWPAAERQAHVLQSDPQPLRPAGVASDDLRRLLSEGSAWTTTIAAPEAAHLKVQHDKLAGDGLIGNPTGIAAVHAP